jgi:DNA-binding NarL/FixJ family response regulator
VNAVLFSSPVLGGLEPAVDDALAVVGLARGSDPLIAASYLHNLARTLAAIGRYEEAEPIADEAIALSESAGLDFALPHGHVSRAVAVLGLGDYVAAERALAAAEDVSSRINDQHNLADVRAVRARSAISRRETDVALAASLEPPRGATPAMRAEYTTIRALAFACAGRVLEADNALSTIRDLSSLPDANALAIAARAVIAAVRRDRSALHDELMLVRSTGIVDPLVVAYRGSPELSAIADLGLPDLQRTLERVKLDAADSAVSSLTLRERDVLSLLKRGQTNKEIAAQLFITEATAKLHVRHILKKLGVRSRTEAAILTIKLAPEVVQAALDRRETD